MDKQLAFCFFFISFSLFLTLRRSRVCLLHSKFQHLAPFHSSSIKRDRPRNPPDQIVFFFDHS